MNKILNLFPQEGVRKYAKNITWHSMTKVLMLILNFIAGILVIRHLGPEKFGYIGYAVSLVGLFSFIVHMGIDQIVYRDILKTPEEKKEIFINAIFIKSISSIIALIALIITALAFSTTYEIWFILIIGSSFIFQPLLIFNYEVQATIRGKLFFFINSTNSVVINLLRIILVFLTSNPLLFAIVYLIDPLILSIQYFILFKNFLKGFFSKINKKIITHLLSHSWPLALTSGFAFIYSRIDQIMIKNIIDIKAVGIYEVVLRLSEVWMIIPNILASALFPALVNSSITNNREYKKRSLIILFVNIFIASIIALIIMIFSEKITILLFGQEFIHASATLKIYVWSIIGTFSWVNMFYILVNSNKQKILMFGTIISAVLNVILNTYLIPRYGINGAAWATVISYNLLPILLITPLIFKKN